MHWSKIPAPKELYFLFCDATPTVSESTSQGPIRRQKLYSDLNKGSFTKRIIKQ